jgi:hypothetical protein
LKLSDIDRSETKKNIIDNIKKTFSFLLIYSLSTKVIIIKIEIVNNPKEALSPDIKITKKDIDNINKYENLNFFMG